MYHLLQGLQYNNTEITQKCLKLITKLLAEDPRNLHPFLEEEGEFMYVLENLCYHRDEFISKLA